MEYAPLCHLCLTPYNHDSSKPTLTTAKFKFVSLYLLALLLSTCRDGARHELVGVQLSPPVYDLMCKVERNYGKTISAASSSNQRWEIPGTSKIDDDGTPVVVVNSTSGKNEATIAHELMHLWGWSEGVPWVGFHGDKPVPQLMISFIRDDLYDQIFHASFYPKIKKLGIDPTAAERNYLQALIAAHSLPVASESLRRQSLALYYFRAQAVLHDSTLAEQLATVYKGANVPAALRDGKHLVGEVQAHDLNRPDEVLYAFIDAANGLFAGEYHFSVYNRFDRQQGNVTVKTAIVYVQPIT
jgi:hypothetical protein